LATALLEEGIDVAVVSAILGHASPGFTMSVYQHVREGMAEQAAEAIERAFGQ
jgi:site-specific recombinase XerD